MVDKRVSLQHKNILVTGGSSGIGRSLVQQLVEQQAKVSFVDIETPDFTTEATFFDMDIADPSAPDQLFSTLHKNNSLPDILICNAGRGIHEKLAEGDPKKWESILNINLLGTLRFIRAFVPTMLEKGDGDIVFVSSVSARSPYEGGGIYSAGKAGLEMIAETLRLEVQPKVRVSVIAPGVVDTEFFRNLIGGNQTPESIGWGALLPEDISDAIIYAITRPRRMAINYLTLRPAAQPM